MLNKFCKIYSKKNYDILKHIYEENEIVSEKLKQKIDEYIKKREEAKPLQIATGKCGNPCYAYQKKIVFNCPKCDGNVNSEVENDYESLGVFDQRSRIAKIIKKYKEKNICTRFDFNENIDKCDVSVDECIKFYEKVDDKKVVHWSCDTKNTSNYNERTVIPVEKDMPIHYMMLDGERFDFPYGMHMRDFFILNHGKFFMSDIGSLSIFMCFKDEQYFRSKKMLSLGEFCNMFQIKTEEGWGQSCGYLDSSVHVVHIYECDDCHLKYHVIKTSPFHFRDKSKDPK